MVKDYRGWRAFGQASTLPTVCPSFQSLCIADPLAIRTKDHERAFVLVVPEPQTDELDNTAATATKPAQGASSSKAQATPAAKAQTGEPEMFEYLLSETEQSQKLARQKFLYMEDRRRYEFNGTSKRRGKASIPGCNTCKKFIAYPLYSPSSISTSRFQAM